MVCAFFKSVRPVCGRFQVVQDRSLRSGGLSRVDVSVSFLVLGMLGYPGVMFDLSFLGVKNISPG